MTIEELTEKLSKEREEFFSAVLEKIISLREGIAGSDIIPMSREKSIVLTKLDEARLWLEEAKRLT